MKLEGTVVTRGKTRCDEDGVGQEHDDDVEDEEEEEEDEVGVEVDSSDDEGADETDRLTSSIKEHSTNQSMHDGRTDEHLCKMIYYFPLSARCTY